MLEHHALAAAGTADDHRGAGAGNGQVYAVQHLLLAERLVHLPQFDNYIVLLAH